MKHRRDRERGAFNTNLELLIFVAIIGILAAIAIPLLVQRSAKQGRACLENLVVLTDKPGEKKDCPGCDKPYAVATSKGAETLACPAPGEHLPSNPRFLRAPGGAWTLEQTLPDYKGEPIELKSAVLEIKEQPGRTSVFSKPSFAARWLVGGILGLFLGILTLIFLVSLLKAVLKKEKDTILGGIFGTAIPGLFLYFVIMGAGSSHQWVFEPAAARATRIDYVMGSTRSETVYTGCLGVVPSGSKVVRLELVHAPDADGKRVTTLGEIANTRSDIARWFNRAVLGR